jgi:ubiquinone/menaquinone biosynthesis C-methylase UbiE
MTAVKNKPTVPPAKILGYLWGSWASQILQSAVELEFFAALESGGKTAAEVAAIGKSDLRGTTVLLNALVGLELLTKDKECYLLTDVAQTYLLPAGDLYMGKMVLGSNDLHQSWTQLTAAVKSGKSSMKVNQDAKAEEFFPELAASIFPLSFATAEAVAQELEAEKLPAGARVLDVASGSAVWSIPFARANKGIKIDALDFPSVLQMMDKFTKKYQVADRYNKLTGNWREVKLEQAAYDVIILGHILHSEGRDLSGKLIGACYDALKPGGKLVVAEFFADENRTSPAPALMFDVNMFLATENGCVFSEADLKSMFKEQGFGESYRLELPALGDQSPIMVAKR